MFPSTCKPDPSPLNNRLVLLAECPSPSRLETQALQALTVLLN